jgi:hypothetical protein
MVILGLVMLAPGISSTTATGHGIALQPTPPAARFVADPVAPFVADPVAPFVADPLRRLSQIPLRRLSQIKDKDRRGSVA